MPLMEDAYYLESQVLQFLSELSHLKKPALTDVVFQIYLLSFSDEFLKKWTINLMHSCCKKLIQQPMMSTINSFTYLGYLTIVHEVLKRDRFKAAWLQSPHFFDDL